MATVTRGLAMLAAVAVAAGLTVNATVGTALAARTRVAHWTPAGSAVVHPVSEAAQAGARAFWTPARMASATPLGQARTSGNRARHDRTRRAIPDPSDINGVPTVGALFLTTGTRAHFCTASVVNSTALDLVLTAAHCVYRRHYASHIAYVPQWHKGISPDGAWAVHTIMVARGWVHSHDPDLDFAFLAVTPPPGTNRPIQRVTGGLRLGVDRGYAHRVYVIGYNDRDDKAIGCATTSVEFEARQLEFYCNDFSGGTSGGPWVLNFNALTGHGTVIGDIGGYQLGGDHPWVSYSPYYTRSIKQLYTEAEHQQLRPAHPPDVSGSGSA
jgi:V8-like Glu-specific endopeptidase